MTEDRFMDDDSEPIARQVLSAQVKDRILQWILEGELAPGSRIVETRVARRLGYRPNPLVSVLMANLAAARRKPWAPGAS